MFWGLVLEPSKSYAQVVDTPFHVSMAALDLKNSDNQEEASTLILRQDNTEYVLANLSKKHKIFNTTLGLDFDIGEEIEFFVQGQSQIHLTGFLAGDDNDDDLDDLNEEDDEEENDIEEKLKDIRKAEAAKRKLKENSSNPAKKQKILDESFNDDTDEDDFNFDEDDLDEDDSDDSAEDDDDDDEDDSDEMDDDEIPSPPKKEVFKAQQQKQAVAQSPETKKQKKKQQQQQQQQQQGKQGKSPQKNQQPNKTPQKTPQGKNQNQAKTPQTGNKQQNAKSPGEAQQAKRPAKKIIKGGIVVEDISEGSGKVAQSNKSVGVYYVGRLCSNKKEFDKSVGGKPFNFKLGRGEVIRGWDLGVEGMREGGKRKITIPAKFAYGQSGAPPAIPPNSALEFEVTLVNVK